MAAPFVIRLPVPPSHATGTSVAATAGLPPFPSPVGGVAYPANGSVAAAASLLPPLPPLPLPQLPASEMSSSSSSSSSAAAVAAAVAVSVPAAAAAAPPLVLSPAVPLRDAHFTGLYQPLTPKQYAASSYRQQLTPIVIDMGSYETRAGFATDPLPRLRFRTLVAKQPQPLNAAARTAASTPAASLVGHVLADVLKRGGDPAIIRLKPRSPFDRNVCTQFEIVERLFDYIFVSLGLEGAKSIDHPIIITEPVANPNLSRAQMSELLFECYRVPSVCYGVDSMFSFYYNQSQGLLSSDSKDGLHSGLIVHSSHEATHIYPVLRGRPAFSHCARIAIGGTHINHLLSQNVLLRFPYARQHLSTTRVQYFVENYLQISPGGLSSELKLMEVGIDNHATAANGSVQPVTIILPAFDPKAAIAREELTEELKAEKAERKKQNTDRLRKMAAEKRDQRLAEHQTKIARFDQIIAWRTANPERYQTEIRAAGLEDEKDLMKNYNELKRKVTRSLTGSSSGALDVGGIKKTDAELYPFINTPDSELTPEQIKEKRKQRLAKNAADARERIKKEKDAAKEKDRIIAEAEEARRLADPVAFIKELRDRKAALIAKRAARQKERSELGNRRSAQSKKRMQLLAYTSQAGEKEDETFGMNDDDWQVYRTMQTHPEMDSDSEAEKNEIAKLDAKIDTHAPKDSKNDGRAMPTTIQLFVDRIRAPELLYEPAILGFDQAGLAECVHRVLANMETSDQASVVRNIFVSGGVTRFPQFTNRLNTEVRAIRPANSTFAIVAAQDAVLDSWRGAKSFAASTAFAASCFTRAEYATRGATDGYLKEHACSNVWSATPPSAVGAKLARIATTTATAPPTAATGTAATPTADTPTAAAAAAAATTANGDDAGRTAIKRKKL